MLRVAFTAMLSRLLLKEDILTLCSNYSRREPMAMLSKLLHQEDMLTLFGNYKRRELMLMLRVENMIMLSRLLLLEKGEDVYAREGLYSNAYQAAAEGRHHDIIWILQKSN